MAQLIETVAASLTAASCLPDLLKTASLSVYERSIVEITYIQSDKHGHLDFDKGMFKQKHNSHKACCSSKGY